MTYGQIKEQAQKLVEQEIAKYPQDSSDSKLIKLKDVLKDKKLTTDCLQAEAFLSALLASNPEHVEAVSLQFELFAMIAIPQATPKTDASNEFKVVKKDKDEVKGENKENLLPQSVGKIQSKLRASAVPFTRVDQNVPDAMSRQFFFYSYPVIPKPKFENPASIAKRGDDLVKKGNYQKALTLLNKVEPFGLTDKNRYFLYLNKAICHEKLFSYAEARYWIQEAIETVDEVTLDQITFFNDLRQRIYAKLPRVEPLLATPSFRA